jgi:hypothetical protein
MGGSNGKGGSAGSSSQAGSAQHPNDSGGEGGTGGAEGGAAAGGQAGAGDQGGGAHEEVGGAAIGGSNGGLPEGGEGAEGGAPPLVSATCDLLAVWGNPQPLAGISTPDADETLLALTADELSLIFRRDSELYRSERASRDEAWQTPVGVTLPEGYTAEHGVALSQDGLRLVLTQADRRAFAEITRSSRDDDFGPTADSSAFFAINDESGYQNYDYGWPLIAVSDQALYYVGQYGNSFVFPSTREAAGWIPGWELYDASSGLGGNARLITGLSADERTLFAFDEHLGYVVSVWRDGPSEPFKLGGELPERLTALPSVSCQQLYTTRVVDASLDIVVETPE